MTHARSLKTHRRSCDHSHEINTTEKDAVCTIPFIYCPINVIRVNYPVSSPSNQEETVFGHFARKERQNRWCTRAAAVSCPIRPKLWVATGAGCTCRIAAVHQQPAGFQNGRFASAPQLIAGLDDAPCYCFTECTHAASTNALCAAVTNALEQWLHMSLPFKVNSLQFPNLPSWKPDIFRG